MAENVLRMCVAPLGAEITLQLRYGSHRAPAIGSPIILAIRGTKSMLSLPPSVQLPVITIRRAFLANI